MSEEIKEAANAGRVLDESRLRFELFPVNGTRRTGYGIPGTLFEIVPKDVLKHLPEAKVHLATIWDEFCTTTWAKHPQMRLIWCASPPEDFHEMTFDIKHARHLSSLAWQDVVQWADKPPALAATMICDDSQGRKKRGHGEFIYCHLQLSRLNPSVISLPEKSGHLFLLRMPKELGLHPNRLAVSASIPVAMRVRLSRNLLARAAWLQLQTPVFKKHVIERVLRLDGCSHLDLYANEQEDIPPLRWSAMLMDACDTVSLEIFAARVSAWLRRDVDGHVYARCLRIQVQQLALDDVHYLFAIVQMMVWILLVQHDMKKPYPVELHGISPEAQALLVKLEADTALEQCEKRLPPDVVVTYKLLLKEDPMKLPNMKLLFVKPGCI